MSKDRHSSPFSWLARGVWCPPDAPASCPLSPALTRPTHTCVATHVVHGSRSRLSSTHSKPYSSLNEPFPQRDPFPSHDPFAFPPIAFHTARLCLGEARGQKLDSLEPAYGSTKRERNGKGKWFEEREYGLSLGETSDQKQRSGPIKWA